MGRKMAYECLNKLFKVVDGLIGERVKPRSSDPPTGGWKHSAFSGVSSAIEVQRGLKARNVVVGVNHPIIPFAKDL